MTEIQAFDDDLPGNLLEGWEWRRFRLIEANDKRRDTNMSATDPNNTPDFAVHGGYLDRLVRSSQRYVADQAREMGLKVGDVIVGREGGGDPVTGWWQEQRLTLRYLGEQCCVWKSEWSNKAIPEFRNDGESANWTLSCRDWYLVRQNVQVVAPPPQDSAST